ncbi:MAG: DnaB-like helicase C-terminal domain-containing protein [Thermodesulfobacteriota bacterium]|nr:DnaB-like helicase C-terminal domain-containing protein [Thermodesulfobacteriota bacterium]
MPQKFSFADQFIDPRLEWSLLAAMVADPNVYWETLDSLPPGVLMVGQAAYDIIAAAVEAEKPIPPFDNLKEVSPAPDPSTAAKELANLYQKRHLAQMVQVLADKLRGESKAEELIAQTESELTQIQTAIREMRSGQAMSVADLLPEVLKEMASRQEAVKETGTAAVGLPTGIKTLDMMLGGLQTGLHILSAEPGEGKTSLALQFAAKVAEQAPALFVSFEEPLNRLVLKSVCQPANLEMKRFFDGYGDLAQLNTAIATYGSRLRALYLIEGSSRLTVPQLKAKALQIAARHKTNQCFVIIDYLQQWASSRREFSEFRHVVGALVTELRDIANRLNSPILVISSQNRGGQGSSFMTSLKESGDLEYTADSILFLVKSKRIASPPARAVDLNVSKNRFGGTGTVPLIFRPNIGIFREEAKI